MSWSRRWRLAVRRPRHHPRSFDARSRPFLAASERSEVASHSRGAGPLVASGAELHPLGTRRGIEAAARPRAGARRRSGQGLPRRQQRADLPEGAGRHQKGRSAAERDTREALGRSRGGHGSKDCLIADGRGRAIAFRIAPGRLMNCRMPSRCSKVCHGLRYGWWVSAAISAMASASTFGKQEHDLRSRPNAKRRRWPARTGSTTIEMSSSASGRGSRNGGLWPPATKRLLSASSASYASLPPSIGSSDDRP